MNIVEVIPIVRGAHRETLSYFTGKEITPGSFALVSVRGKKVPAIIISSKKAVLSKSDIKASPFKLKKIDDVRTSGRLSLDFIKAAERTGEYFAARTGAVLRMMMPKALDEMILENKYRQTEDVDEPKIKRVREKFLVQADEEERFSIYKSIIREEFAGKKSVFLCLPEIFEIEKYAKSVEKGIKEYTFILHGNLPAKEVANRIRKLYEEKHPVLIIGTGTFLSLGRTDLGTIILDRESSPGYKTKTRPFIDIRKFSEFLAEESGIRLIMGDMALRAETIFRKEKGEFAELLPLKFRSVSEAASLIIDLKKPGEDFKILSDEAKDLVLKSREKNEHLFVLANRRGSSPLTACSDCGAVQSCDHCGTPLVLHKKSGGNSFICHKCGKEYEAKDRCVSCGGWKFKMLGVGIEQVAEEIKNSSPGIKIFRLDSDTAKTHKKCLEIVEKFYSSPGSVLVGTVKAIVYLDKKVDNVIVAAVDSMLGVPDFRMNERIFNVLLRSRRLALKNFLIQTRKTDNKVFEYAAKGDLINFYREEIADRELLNYPPLSVLVKISFFGKPQILREEMGKLSEILKEWSPEVFPGFIPMKRGLSKINILLKLPREKWIDRKLLGTILSLSPQTEVRVDPEDIL